MASTMTLSAGVPSHPLDRGTSTVSAAASPIADRTTPQGPGSILPQGPDPRSGEPFATAAQASAAAGGSYVPDCQGHTEYYVQRNGAVVTFFQGSDAQLWSYPPQGPFISGPIPSSTLVAPRTLVVQGQSAYGYEATPHIAQLTPTHLEGVLVHSYLTWRNHGSSLQLESATDLSLSQLETIANGCI